MDKEPQETQVVIATKPLRGLAKYLRIDARIGHQAEIHYYEYDIPADRVSEAVDKGGELLASGERESGLSKIISRSGQGRGPDRGGRK